MKKFIATVITAFVVLPSTSFAATPDGMGPWADYVVAFNQGMMKNGLNVPAARSNPTAALGVAENNTVDTNFVSLGFGGKLTLGFDNGFKSAVIVVEATNPNYPVESAKIDVSSDGVSWIEAGTVNQDGQVNVPASLGCARFVRLTDVNDPATYPDEIADGFDVDGVQVTGDTCTPPTACLIDCCSSIVANITGNGAGSINKITINNTQIKIINQTNILSVSNVVGNKTNTGKNKITKNNGGTNTVITGKAKSVVSVETSGGINIVN